MVLASLFATLLWAGDANATTVAAARTTITASRLLERAAILASDAMAGRNAGSPGNDRAAAYLAQCVEDLGLEPRGQDGGYLDWFTFPIRFRGEDVRTQNVVALWRGSDPELSKEVVVLGAHFDHVGQTGEPDAGRAPGGNEGDTIWNGADDNASGATVLLAVADAVARSQLRPKRSLVFAWFSAEEHGLYGSKHYVEMPTRPLANTTLMINLDMVGRNPKQPAEVLGVFSARGDTLRQLVAQAGTAGGLSMDVKTEPPEDDSDHASFLEHGVPAVFFFTGYHEDYHRNSDHADKLSGERMQEVARTALSLAIAAADLPERLRFNPDIRPRKLGIQVGDPVAAGELAALPDYASDGAIAVRMVTPDSVAAKSGLRANDLIVELAGERFPREGAQAKLRALLSTIKRGEPVPMRVVRNRQVIELSATWPTLDPP